MFREAQKAFKEWEKQRKDGKQVDKDDLLERLGADFLSLLDVVSLARSRRHIERYYPEVVDRIGGFPKRKPPENRFPETDAKGKLSYKELNQKILDLDLAVYYPANYMKDSSQLDREKGDSPFTQKDRERNLIHMMRVNLLKRLESSVHAFRKTLGRIRDKHNDRIDLIEDWRQKGFKEVYDFDPEADSEDDRV